MPKFDLHNSVGSTPALNPQTISSDTTTAGHIIDTQSYEAVEFIVQVGTVTAGTVTPSLAASASSDMSSPVTVDTAAEGLLGSLSALSASNTCNRFGYSGPLRYVRLSVVTASSANLTVGAVAVKARPQHMPVA